MKDLPAREAALVARYGTEAPPLPAGPWNEVIACLLQHRTVRAYRPDALPPGTLETLVAAAQSAATSSNMQAWSVVAVTEQAAKAVLARLAGNQKQIEQAPLVMVWVADLSRLQRVGDGLGQSCEALPFFEAFLFAAVDAGLAAQNAIVAAESLGLYTCYIGALRNDVELVASTLGLPPGAVGIVGLCVGYEDASAGAAMVKPRLPQSVVLHRERYSTAAEPEGNAAYDRALTAFSEKAERTPYTWTERVISRVGRIAGLGGRDKLRDAMARLGFPLR
jgi:nitroreductase